jgi:type IV secretion system protein VirD4
MNVAAVHEAIDQALLAAFTTVSGLVLLAAGALQTLWNTLPDSWHPAIKAVVIGLVLVYGARLLRFFIRLPFHISSRFISLSLLKLRSPFGRSDWASLRSLRHAGMLKPGGLFLGQWRSLLRSADLFRQGEGHLLTVAGSGAGKTTGLVIPALCELSHGSVIVTDPKAQLAAMTARHRRTLGPVFFINPFALDLESSTGQALPDDGFNPLSVLDDGYNLKDDAENLARLLMVTDRQDSGSYWNDESAGLIAALLVWMVTREPPEHRTLSFLWRMVRENETQLEQRFGWMASDAMPFLRAEGEKLLGLLAIKPQWQGVISKAQLATSRYAPQTPLGDHTAKTGFDLARLKREDVTVYIMIPTGRAKVASPWLNLLVGAFGLAIGKPGKARPVFLLMDEAPALGYLPDLRNHLRESREAGLRAWIFTQTRAALAAPELYGDNGFDDIMGLCETKAFFSIGEPRLAREISEMMGERTATNRSRGDAGGSDKENLSVVGVPLMRSEDVLRLRRGRLLILRSGLRPIRAQLVPYWTRQAWAVKTDKNPYRG